MMTIIAAVAADGAIGRKGDLLWHISEDLKHFKSLTMGKPVVMGRNTWESLPKKPLPGRLNIVVTSTKGYDAPGAEIAGSLEEAMQMAEKEGDYFVIGGGRLYAAAMQYADSLELTEIDSVAEDADTWFPEIEKDEWEIAKSEEVSGSGHKFRFVTYTRRK